MRSHRMVLGLLASLVASGALAQESGRSLPECGTVYAEPFGRAAERRVCPPERARAYVPVHAGIGFDVLNAESEVCFVPDAAYRLLDEIVSEVVAAMGVNPGRRSGLRSDQATLLKLSRVTGEVLASRGFGLYVPTETLSDALTNRAPPSEHPRHIVDCDTSSLILLTAAEAVGLSGSLVEITLRSGAGHNFVRWTTADGVAIDWDTNGRQQCVGPTKTLPYQGRAMTRDQVMGYVVRLRNALWKERGDYTRAAKDYRLSISLWPEHPLSYNNLAWMIATRPFPERSAMTTEAVQAADRAIALDRRPDYLDTAGCAYAAAGRFDEAARLEAEALAGEPDNADYKARLAGFRAASPRDCLGAE